MEDLAIITTGGTIDATKYDFKTGIAQDFESPAIEGILRQGGVRCGAQGKKTEIVSLPPKDSLFMTDQDRRVIRDACLRTRKQRVVITHGTDTIVETGLFLRKEVTGKTIVLVGAMRPYFTPESDASFNVGTAVGAAETLEPGVYLAMQGEIFPIDQVTKIKSDGDPYFQALDTFSPKARGEPHTGAQRQFCDPLAQHQSRW